MSYLKEVIHYLYKTDCKSEKNLYLFYGRVYNMVSTKTKTKTKNIDLLTLISTTFILSIVSYAIPSLQSQQAFGQGAFQTAGDDQSPPQLIMDQANNETDQTGATTTTTTENNQKIILGGITIPITSDTYLSLELPDSTITVQPNK
jgi:hypothetical protein